MRTRNARSNRSRPTLAPAALAISLLSALAVPALAQTSAPTPPAPESPPAAPESAASSQPSDASAAELPSAEASEAGKLRLQIAPYIWLPSFNGSITLKGVNMNIDESFFDIVDQTERIFGLMGAIDVQYERFVFQFDGSWMTADISDQRGAAQDVNIDMDLTLNTTWLEFYAGYRLIEEPLGENPAEKRYVTLDAFVGGRVTMVDSDVSLRATGNVTLPDGTELPIDASRSASPYENWAEPLVGLRLGANLTDRWAINLRGDVGGFGAGSDFAWQASGVVGYRWWTDSGTISLFLGYRALSQDYSSGDFTWDLTVHGPILGVEFGF